LGEWGEGKGKGKGMKGKVGLTNKMEGKQTKDPSRQKIHLFPNRNHKCIIFWVYGLLPDICMTFGE
jgi:hypothetical protein